MCCICSSVLWEEGAMKKCSTQTGSALLVLLLVMTVLTLLLQQRLRCGSFSYDVVVVRSQQCKRQWATHALLKYGIAWCKAHTSDLLQADLGKKYELQVAWPLYSDVTVPGIVIVQRTADGVIVTATLQDAACVILSECCTLELKQLTMTIKKVG